MSSQKNRNSRHLSKTTELSGHIHVEKPCSPKKERDSIYKQIKNTQKPPDYFSDVRHNNSLPKNTEKSCIQTSSSIVSKEASHQKEFDSSISSSVCVESTQSETSVKNYTRKSSSQENKYSLEPLKEHSAKSPSKRKEENIDQLNCQLLCEHKNVIGNNWEVPTTTEINETFESLPLNTSTNSSIVSAGDKKKERRKMVKKLAKDEKRKQRELEYKKNLQPKGQRIRVIDHNTFHKILKNAESVHIENKKSLLNSEEFPALNVLKCNNRFPVIPCQNSTVQYDTEKLKMRDKASDNVGVSVKISEMQSVVTGEMVNKAENKFDVPSKLGAKDSLKKVGKLRKKRDPIQIDILQCIKMVKSKDAVLEQRKKLCVLERSSLISGNELDSSNPQRSRGKKREKPKKKRPTRLKLVILHERELRNQLKKLQESDLSQGEKVCFGTEKSTYLQTAGGIKLEQREPVTNVSDNGIVETMPGTTNLLTAGDIKLDQVDPVINGPENKVVKAEPGLINSLEVGGIELEQVKPASKLSGNEVVETVPGSTNLPTTGSIMLEQVEPSTNMPDNEVHKTMLGSMNVLTTGRIKLEKVWHFSSVSDSEVFEIVPGSTNLLTAADIKLEQVESVSDVPDNEAIGTVSGVEDISKEDKHKYEVPSSDCRSAVIVMNQCLNAEDDSQTYLLSNLHITNDNSYKNERERVPGLVPPLLCSASYLKQGHESVATVGDDIKPTHISSNAVKHKVLHSPQVEHCISSLEAISLSDPGTCSELNQMDCRKFLTYKACDASSDQKEIMQNAEIHSRKFRPYCDHFITPEINDYVTILLQDIVKFHDRQFAKDPVKANARRRHVVGLREVLKYLSLKRLKLIIIAPDLELIQSKGGICDIVEQLKESARIQEIPYVFALYRRKLGKLTFKKVPVSCIGVINYDGTEKNFHSLVAALQVSRTQYQEALRNTCYKEEHSEEVDINKQVIQATLSRLTENSSVSCSETVQK